MAGKGKYVYIERKRGDVYKISEKPD